MSVVLEAPRSVIKHISKVSKPDKDGYYTVLAGGVNIVSSEGYLYKRTNAVVNLFNQSSSLMRRINSAALFSEVEHPARLPGMSDREFAERWLFLDKSRECGFIKSLELSNTPIAVPNQSIKVYPIYMKIKPQGAFGAALKENLDNPDTNVAFSIRCLSKRGKDTDGTLIRTLLYVITFDWVNEPGINAATQSVTGLITKEMMSIDESDVDAFVNFLEEHKSMMTGEEAKNYADVRSALKCDDLACVYSEFN